MIKLLFTDMDGTLLRDNKDMPARAKEVLGAIADKGVIAGIATGRSLPSLYRDFAGIETQLAYIAENGAIVQYKGEYICKEVMDRELVQRILRTALSLDDVYPVVACATSAYIGLVGDELTAQFRYYYPTIHVMDDLLQVDDDIVKVALYCSKHQAEQVFAAFSDFTDVGISISGADWVDLSTKGVNKGRGIAEFQKRFNITKAETMAFGDYMNDYEMLQNAGESYAMDNAYPKVKEVCKYVIGTNEEEAVIKVLLEKFEI
ncbi:MAG: Cof-type HAD-IIB family hydrolase [Deferribacteraceae bacterium]|nr:Cof-type HAD-IIB family hydrolase [Deferribacteraceae bacterium]